jgi:dipeptide/tripeptide permease
LSLQGKYRTILYLSIVYCIGNWVMALAAAPKPSPSTKSTLFWSTALALALIALGTGGIKPCVSAFGGDQIQFTLPDGPAKDRLHRQFFSMYYFAVNAGSLISTLLTPVLRTDVSYSVAFAVPAALMMCALLIFWCGRRSYINRPPEGNVFGEVGAVVVDAIRLRGRAGQGSHWLDSSKLKHNPTVVEDVKALFRVLILLLPTPLFWSLFDQQSSKWVFQASKLDGHVPWLFNVVIEPDQMQVTILTTSL